MITETTSERITSKGFVIKITVTAKPSEGGRPYAVDHVYIDGRKICGFDPLPKGSGLPAEFTHFAQDFGTRSRWPILASEVEAFEAAAARLIASPEMQAEQAALTREYAGVHAAEALSARWERGQF